MLHLSYFFKTATAFTALMCIGYELDPEDWGSESRHFKRLYIIRMVFLTDVAVKNFHYSSQSVLLEC